MKAAFLSGMIIVLLAVTLLPALYLQLPQVNAAPARTITVPNDYPTIQAAINNASYGDTVVIKQGTYHENITINKTITLQGENKQNTIIDANKTGNVVEVVADNVVITGFTIQNTASNQTPYSSNGIYLMANYVTISNNIITANSNHGINLINSNANTIKDNNISANYWSGIVLQYSDYNTISNNNIIQNTQNNSGIGILLQDSTDFNIIEKNTVAKNDAGIGLSVSYSSYGCSDNIIKSNTVSDNTHDGIFVYDFCLRNRIELNDVARNGGGIHLSNADKNVIVENNISHNRYGGIAFEDVSLNLFFHNSLIENTPQIWRFTSGNVWDNGYPSGGNYWSNYHGADANNDGIGDTSYVVDGNIQDRYPLMSPYQAPATTYRMVDFSGTFRNSEGAPLDAKPYYFKLVSANGTFSPPLSVGTYLVQTGTTVITSIIWEDTEVSPDLPFTFDAADGNPVVNCSVYQLTIDPVFHDLAQNITATQPKSWGINFPNGTVQNVSSTVTYAQVQAGYYAIGRIAVMGTEVASPRISTWLSSNMVWSPKIDFFSLGGNLSFAFDSNSNITQMNYNKTSQILSFTATGANGTDGMTKISFPKTLVNNPYEVIVRVDDNQIGFTATWLDEFWLIEIQYKHSAHAITMDFKTDRPVIPEFPSTIILTAILLATVLVAVFLRKHNRAGAKVAFLATKRK